MSEQDERPTFAQLPRYLQAQARHDFVGAGPGDGYRYDVSGGWVCSRIRADGEMPTTEALLRMAEHVLGTGRE